MSGAHRPSHQATALRFRAEGHHAAVEIDALVLVRKHNRRSAGLALPRPPVPLLVFIDGLNSTAIPVALVAGLASAALFRGRFGAARVLVPLLAALNALLVIVVAVNGTPSVEEGFYPATVFWLAVFLFGSLEGLLGCMTPSARRMAASPLIEVVLAGDRKIATLFPGGPRAGSGVPGSSPCSQSPV